MRKARKSSDSNAITLKKNLSFTKWSGRSGDHSKRLKCTPDSNNSSSVNEKDGPQNTLSVYYESGKNAVPASIRASPIKPDGDSCQKNFENCSMDQPLTESLSKINQIDEHLFSNPNNKVSTNRTNLNGDQQNPGERSSFVDNFVAMMKELELMNISYLKDDIISKMLSNLTQNSNLKFSERVSTPIPENSGANTDEEINNASEGSRIPSNSDSSEELSRMSGVFDSKILRSVMKYSNRNDRRSVNERTLSSVRKEPTASNSKNNLPISQRAVSLDRLNIRSSYSNRPHPPNDKANICWYFWVPETQAFLINNPKDRRVEALVRSSRSKVYLHREKRVNTYGEHQQLVAIYSPDKFYLTKCKNLINEKFPIFKVNCGSEKEPGSIAEFY
ncbi:unnamed protein product [Hymenolepis diminuta]|uniref:Uncharacterized protein n=1 Tax=Hymenolepis diminuta TaxID=6216 RepID=A0A564YGR9_HYMDI|nr:unnamed protein product [Hymenolepis diminuta]